MSTPGLGGLFGEGLQMMLDGQQRYVRGGFQCFLRVQNFPPTGAFQELGLQIAATGSMPNGSGFTDILIDPPPEILDVSMHNIGQSGGKLQFGAKIFKISHTFVEVILMTYPAILDSYDVFRDWDGGLNQTGQQTASTIGFIYGDRMYSVEDIKQSVAGGRILEWVVTGNVHELQLASAAGEVRVP